VEEDSDGDRDRDGDRDGDREMKRLEADGDDRGKGIVGG
jgi:hypothetical protein